MSACVLVLVVSVIFSLLLQPFLTVRHVAFVVKLAASCVTSHIVQWCMLHYCCRLLCRCLRIGRWSCRAPLICFRIRFNWCCVVILRIFLLYMPCCPPCHILCGRKRQAFWRIGCRSCLSLPPLNHRVAYYFLHTTLILSLRHGHLTRFEQWPPPSLSKSGAVAVRCRPILVCR